MRNAMSTCAHCGIVRVHITLFFQCWQCRCAVEKTWVLSPKLVSPILLYASLVWWKRVELSHLQRMTCLNDVFGNYWWYAFNTNVCFRGYVNVNVWLTRRLYCWLKGTNLWPLIYSIWNFRSIFLQEMISLRNVLIWLHQIDSFSLLMAYVNNKAYDILNARESYALGSRSIRSICYIGVFGILHFGRHGRQSNINLLW
jgi:hypothetical protein